MNLTADQLAGIAKHNPEELVDWADDVRAAMRRLESFESAALQSVQRKQDDDGYCHYVVVLYTDDPECWNW